MIIEESTPTLESLQAEIVELRRSVEKLQAAMLAVKPESDRETRLAKAKQEIFTEYDSLLSELAKHELDKPGLAA